MDGDNDALSVVLADEELDMHEVEPPSPQTYVGAERGRLTTKSRGLDTPVATDSAICTEEKLDGASCGIEDITAGTLDVGGTYSDALYVARLARRRPPTPTPTTPTPPTTASPPS